MKADETYPDVFEYGKDPTARITFLRTGPNEWFLTGDGIEATARIESAKPDVLHPWLMEYNGSTYRALTLVEAGRIIWALREGRPLNEGEHG